MRSGWTETRAIRNKAWVRVVEALDVIAKRLPFALEELLRILPDLK